MTTIVRKEYETQHCRLAIEGPGEAEKGPGEAVHAEYRFENPERTVSGDRAFLESSIKAVSFHAKTLLGSVRFRVPEGDLAPLVSVERVHANCHRLIVRPERGDVAISDGSHAIDLTLVQFFDLVEVVDRLLADRDALPEWRLEAAIAPLSRRYALNARSSQQTVPAIVGISSVLVAGFVAAMMPVPEVEPPKPRETEEVVEIDSGTDPAGDAESENGSENGSEDGSDTASEGPAVPDPGEVAAPAASDDEEIAAREVRQALEALQPALSRAESDSARRSERDSEEDARTDADEIGTADAIDPGLLLDPLETSPQVTDPNQIEALTWYLYEQILQGWTPQELDEDAIFQVAVGEDGAVLGYRPGSEEAKTLEAETPLPNLLYVPTGGKIAERERDRESVAWLRVVFAEYGGLEIGPWFGIAEEAEPLPLLPDERQAKARGALFEKLDAAWQGELREEPEFEESLVYEVWVNEAGEVLGYESEDFNAEDYAEDIPLPDLVDPAAIVGRSQAGKIVPAAIAILTVEFFPNGTFDVRVEE